MTRSDVARFSARAALLMCLGMLFTLTFGGSSAHAACSPATSHSTAGTGLTSTELRDFVEDAASITQLDDCELNAILDDADLIDSVPTTVDSDISGTSELDPPSEVTAVYGTRPAVHCYSSGLYATYKNRLGQVLMRYQLSNDWCAQSGRVIDVNPLVDWDITSLAGLLWRYKGLQSRSDRYHWYNNNSHGQYISFRKSSFQACAPIINTCAGSWSPSLLLYVRADGTRTGFRNLANGSAAPGGETPDPSGSPIGDPYEPAGTGSPTPPSVTTAGGSSIAQHGATLSGRVNPNGSATTYHFEYGTTTAYGSFMPVTDDASAGAGTSAVGVSQSISGLVPNLTYHYRLVAANQAGVTFGTDHTLRTIQSSLNGDGKSDLVATNPSNNTIAATLSGGSSFNAAGSGTWLNGWSMPDWMEVGDFNGDGTSDLATTDATNDVVDVTLSSGSSLNASGSGRWLDGWSDPDWMRVGDFDGDGRSDLVATDPSANTVDVTLSSGSSFDAAGSGAWLSGWSEPDWMEVGDFNGDGKSDLVTTDPSNNVVDVALSDGTTLGAPGTGSWLSGWSMPTWMRVGDFNGDGKSDLVATNPSNNTVAVTLSSGTSFNAAGSGTWLNGWSMPAWMEVGDVNGDGLSDLIATNPSNNTVAVTLSNGSSFNAAGSGTWLNGWSMPAWMRVG